jgi:hypothetical protein
MRLPQRPCALDLRCQAVFVVSMDTDWCSAETLDFVLREVVDPRLPLTLFSTGIYLEAANRPAMEMALHYNVDHASFPDAFGTIADILPGARGARGHSLAFSERLRAPWKSYQIVYDSSFLMYLQNHIVPFPIARGVLELPIYFMDMFALEFEEGDLGRFPDYEEMCRPGLKVFDFHPVHLVLNTPSPEYYVEKKQWYHDFHQLRRHQYRGYGVRSYFDEIQRRILDGGHTCTTCLGVCEVWLGEGAMPLPKSA